VRDFQLPDRLKHFLVPGVILLSLLLLTGGLYFWNQGLTSSPKTVVNEDEGAVSGAETGIPNNFPKDIPLFHPSEVLSSLESQEGIQLTLQTRAPAEEVTKFYEQEAIDDRRTKVVVTADPEGPTTIILTVAF